MSTKIDKKRYKKRYVLGEGYPDVSATFIQMRGKPIWLRLSTETLKDIAELDDRDCPKYRLILERLII